MQVNIHEAKTNLSKLLELVKSGEEVIIAKAGKPFARIDLIDELKIKPEERRVFGGWEGKVWVADDFDETSDELINLFYEGEV